MRGSTRYLSYVGTSMEKKKRGLWLFSTGGAQQRTLMSTIKTTQSSVEAKRKEKKKSDACLKLLSRIGGALTSGEELNCRWEGEKEEDYDKRMIKRLSIIAVQARHHFPCSAKKKKKRRITLFWI